MHNGSDSTRDRFTLVARTESKTSVPAAVHVRVIPVDDETPRVVNNTGIRVHAGASVAVTKEHLGELARDIMGTKYMLGNCGKGGYLNDVYGTVGGSTSNADVREVA